MRPDLSRLVVAGLDANDSSLRLAKLAVDRHAEGDHDLFADGEAPRALDQDASRARVAADGDRAPVRSVDLDGEPEAVALMRATLVHQVLAVSIRSRRSDRNSVV